MWVLGASGAGNSPHGFEEGALPQVPRPLRKATARNDSEASVGNQRAAAPWPHASPRGFKVLLK